jgi:GR25 family glycosyltransferase involved in LPS biosynthesis
MNKNIVFVCYPIKQKPTENFSNSGDLFTFVHKVVYINLDERKDRKDSIVNELKCFPENKIIRFSAIKDSPGYLGCSKSHIAVLEMAIKNNWSNVLIVEDDMVWKNFEKGYETLKDLIKKPYDVIVLGAPNPTYDVNTLKLLNGQTTTAYLVNKHYFKTLLENFKKGLDNLTKTNIYHEFALDQYWKLLQKTDNWYVIQPALSMQKESYSDIHHQVVNYEQYFT